MPRAAHWSFAAAGDTALAAMAVASRDGISFIVLAPAMRWRLGSVDADAAARDQVAEGLVLAALAKFRHREILDRRDLVLRQPRDVGSAELAREGMAGEQREASDGE